MEIENVTEAGEIIMRVITGAHMTRAMALTIHQMRRSGSSLYHQDRAGMSGIQAASVTTGGVVRDAKTQLLFRCHKEARRTGMSASSNP